MKDLFRKMIGEITVKALIVSLLFLLSVFVFILLAHEVIGEKEDLFDTIVFRFLERYSTPQCVNFMENISFFGSSYFLIPAYILLIFYLLLKRKNSQAMEAAIISITSTLLILITKGIFQRNRPNLPLLKALNSYSFPSGHALGSFIFCSILIYLIWQSNKSIIWKYIIAGFLILFSLLIGTSRIILRYHHPSDVVAGFILAFAWILLSFWILKKIKWRPENSKSGT